MLCFYSHQILSFLYNDIPASTPYLTSYPASAGVSPDTFSGVAPPHSTWLPQIDKHFVHYPSASITASNLSTIDSARASTWDLGTPLKFDIC